MEECGFASFRPRVAEIDAAIEAEFGSAAERTRLLREALARYREIGATGHVRRLAAEVADEFGDA